MLNDKDNKQQLASFGKYPNKELSAKHQINVMAHILTKVKQKSFRNRLHYQKKMPFLLKKNQNRL